MELGAETLALKAVLEAYPGAEAVPVPMPRGRPSPAVMYRLPLESHAIEEPSWQQEYTDCVQDMMTFSEPVTRVCVVPS